MSTPMPDVPEHMLVPVDKDGSGPVEDQDADHWVCWCGPGRARIKFNGGLGLTLCPQSGQIINHGFPPGWKARR